MQAIASRFPLSRGIEETRQQTNGNLLLETRITPNSSTPRHHIARSSLRDSLNRFRERHNTCAALRRAAITFEAKLESERTEFLARKYSETIKQDQGGSNSTVTSLSIPSATSNNSINNSTSKSTPNTLSLTEPVSTTTMAQSVCPKLNTFSPTAINKPFFSSNSAPSSSRHLTAVHNECHVTIKTEPHDTNNSCSFNNKKKSSVTTPTMTTPRLAQNNEPSNNNNNKMRRRSSKEANNRNTIMSATNNITTTKDPDLALEVERFINCDIPHLVPLEDVEEPPVITTPTLTTPTLKSPPVTKSSRRSINRTPPTATPTTTPTPRLSGDQESLKKELDIFSKVMNQVMQDAEAKNSVTAMPFPLGPTSSTTTPFGPAPSTATPFLGPVSSTTTPFSAPSMTTPFPLSASTASCIPSHGSSYRTLQQNPPPPYSLGPSYPMATPHPSYNNIQYSGTFSGYNETTPFSLDMSHPLQHPPTQTSLSQISTLLSSPVTSTSQGPPPTQSYMALPTQSQGPPPTQSYMAPPTQSQGPPPTQSYMAPPPQSPHLSSFDYNPPPPQYHHRPPPQGGNTSLYGSGQYSSPIYDPYNIAAGQKRSLSNPHNQYTPGGQAPPSKIPAMSHISNCYPSQQQLQSPCGQFSPQTSLSFSQL